MNVKNAQQLDLVITKASIDPVSGDRKFSAVASDTAEDSFGERMSLTLYQDFIQRIESEEAAPLEVSSEAWNGGMPYLSIAHYPDLNGDGIAGEIRSLYIDGNRLKVKGVFADNDIGKSAYASVKADSLHEKPEGERVRVSIAFIDWGHTHKSKLWERKALKDSCPTCATTEKGKNNKSYKKGQLIHLALTRVPVNERTPVWVEERSMTSKATITTVQEDAASIVGDELALELQEKTLEDLVVSESVVIKSEVKEDTPIEPVTEDKSWVPAGGALTLADAEAFYIAKQETFEILDQFALFSDVLFNIEVAEVDVIADKPAAMKAVVAEFKERVDNTVKRSLIDHATGVIKNSLTQTQEVLMDTKDLSLETPAPVAAPAAHVLDEAILELKASFDSALSDPSLTTEQRLEKLQAPYAKVADRVREQVTGPIDQAELIAASIAEQLRPLVESVTLLAQKNKSENGAPTRRSHIPPTQVPTAVNPAQAPEERAELVPNLRSMVRNSVGIKDINPSNIPTP